ncbi:MAG: alpha-ketoglutarate-dependent dioxygenase AlkB [Actinobacteria bacterium]|nr:alpha-ketoglutarate-dependent dioxygenase AlkB [Actinomycetota bacterium]
MHAEDTVATLDAIRSLGAGVDEQEDDVVVRGVGLRTAQAATGGLVDVRNAGTLLRILPGWLAGSDVLFERVLARAPWDRRTVEMYGERVIEPRLTARFPVSDPPTELHVLSKVGAALSARYAVGFVSIGCNLYRDGRDSVAWHGDRIGRDRPTATIAIVSLGERRPFRLRPRGGGRSVGFELGRGDLLVMGGTCQRTWQHTVPKVSDTGPRISVTYRHRYDG